MKIQEAFNELEKAIRADENKEWREGRRCSICGEEKEASNTTDMCSDCWENG